MDSQTLRNILSSYTKWLGRSTDFACDLWTQTGHDGFAAQYLKENPVLVEGVEYWKGKAAELEIKLRDVQADDDVLLEQWAGQALCGVLAFGIGEHNTVPPKAAKDAFDYAEAMLSEYKRRKGGA